MRARPRSIDHAVVRCRPMQRNPRRTSSSASRCAVERSTRTSTAPSCSCRDRVIESRRAAERSPTVPAVVDVCTTSELRRLETRGAPRQWWCSCSIARSQPVNPLPRSTHHIHHQGNGVHTCQCHPPTRRPLPATRYKRVAAGRSPRPDRPRAHTLPTRSSSLLHCAQASKLNRSRPTEHACRCT